MKTKETKAEIVLRRLFWSSVVLFGLELIVVGGGVHLNKLIFLSLLVLFGLVGLALLIVALKMSLERRLKVFLLMASGGTVSFFVFAILHNLVYGLMRYLNRVGSGDEVFFFILAVIVCPIIILVGIIGAAVLLTKRRRVSDKHRKT